MKKHIRAISKWLGVCTRYHVAATYSRDSHMGFYVISLTVDVRPWIHADNYRHVVDYVGSQAEKIVGKPTITSITKLGL